MTVYYLRKMQKEERIERSSRWEVLAALCVCLAIGFLIHIMYQVQKKDDVFHEAMREPKMSYFSAALSERPDLVRLLSDKSRQYTLIVPSDVTVRLSSVNLGGLHKKRENLFAEVERYIYKGHVAPQVLTVGRALEMENLLGQRVVLTRKNDFDQTEFMVNNEPIRKVLYADNGVIFLMNAVIVPQKPDEPE